MLSDPVKRSSFQCYGHRSVVAIHVVRSRRILPSGYTLAVGFMLSDPKLYLFELCGIKITDRGHAVRYFVILLYYNL